MTLSTSKYIQTEAIPESVTAYYELPLKTGEAYETRITESDAALNDIKQNNGFDNWEEISLDAISNHNCKYTIYDIRDIYSNRI